MKCPHCSQEAPDDAAECGACGIIFAKLKAREERALQAARKAAEGPTLRETRQKLKLVLIAFLALWIALAGYAWRKTNRTSKKIMQKAEAQMRAAKQRREMMQAVNRATKMHPDAILRGLKQAGRMEMRQHNAASQAVQKADSQRISYQNTPP